MNWRRWIPGHHAVNSSADWDPREIVPPHWLVLAAKYGPALTAADRTVQELEQDLGEREAELLEPGVTAFDSGRPLALEMLKSLRHRWNTAKSVERAANCRQLLQDLSVFNAEVRGGRGGRESGPFRSSARDELTFRRSELLTRLERLKTPDPLR
jgi:hypothetical protein